MLYIIAEQLGFPGLLNLIRYISFRAGAASATALLIGLLLGPAFIRWLRAKQGKGQPIRADGPQSHLAKRGTPTMGGLLILISVAIATLLWMDLSNPYVWACLLVTGGFGLIGFLDDYDKVKKRSTKGVSGKVRLFFEFLIAGIASWILVTMGGNTHLYVPFYNGPVIDLSYGYILFAAFTTVLSLTIRNCTLDIAFLSALSASLPALTHLAVRQFQLPRSDPMPLLDVPSLSRGPHLTSLDLDVGYIFSPAMHHILSWVAATPSRRTLRAATLAVRTWDAVAASNFLRTVGPRLDTLELRFEAFFGLPQETASECPSFPWG